jgi:hypothetical protein
MDYCINSFTIEDSILPKIVPLLELHFMICAYCKWTPNYYGLFNFMKRLLVWWTYTSIDMTHVKSNYFEEFHEM